jgi:hypothetical protein
MAIGEGLALYSIGVLFIVLTIALGYREWRVSQRIIREAKEWRK